MKQDTLMQTRDSYVGGCFFLVTIIMMLAGTYILALLDLIFPLDSFLKACVVD
jgi:putative Mn2+ efflux pump MntP